MLPVERYQQKPKDKRLIKEDMPFIEELSGIGMVKGLDSATIITLKVKIMRIKLFQM